MKKIPFLLGALGLAACASDAPDVGTTEQAVFVDGDDPLAVPDDGAHPQIVRIRQSFTGMCTGTIVASNKVLTAAHCVNEPSDLSEIDVRLDGNVSDELLDELKQLDGVTFEDGMLFWHVASRTMHPQFDTDDGPLWDSDVDIAVLTMESHISPALIAPLPVLPDMLPSPYIAGQSGYDRWVAYYADLMGAGALGNTCIGSDTVNVIRYSIEVVDAYLGLNGRVMLQWKDSTGFGATHACAGDSGAPFLTVDADYIGSNNIDPGFIMALYVGGGDDDDEGDPNPNDNDGIAIGPLLVGSNRTFVAQQALDADGDGIEAAFDTCDFVSNPGQDTLDSDGDGWPDLGCDDDDDNDGLSDWQDNCDTIANGDQANADGDASGDICDWDDDGDFVADDDDNCPMVSNAGQANCNVDAERLGFAGSNDDIELGDACDPVPCAPAKTAVRTFEQETLTWFVTSEAVCAAQHGRLYEDYVDIVGRVAQSSAPVDTEKLEVWFCPCEEDTLAECKAAPWSCKLAPNAGPALGSRWRKLSLTQWDDLSSPVAQPLAATFDPWSSWLPSDAYLRWDYLTDYDAWVVNEGLWTPTPNNASVYGAGTDMMGLLWVEDPSSVGVGAHGASCSSGSTCSMASSYLTEVAPDRAATITKCHEIPELAPAPWWTYCPMCGDELRMPWQDVINPGYLAILGSRVIVYSPVLAGVEGVAAGAGADVSSMVAEGLLAALRDRNTTFIAPSEVVDQALRAGQARAMAISIDATRMRGQLVAGAQQFELRAWSGTAATGISARTGFATAYSLDDGGVRVVGGVDRNGRTMAEYWRWSRGGWRRTAIDPRVTPTAAVSSVLGGDGAMWVVDRAGGRFTIKHIVEATGAGRVATLDELAGATDAWVFRLADGSVVLATTDRETHLLSRLAWTSDGLRVVAQVRGEGALSGAPYVSGGGIAVPVDTFSGDFAGVGVTVVPAADLAAAE